MKRIYKHILLILCLCMFIPFSINAEDNVCTYGDELTITFKDDGSSELNQEFYETKNKDYLIYQNYAGEVSTESSEIKSQLISLQGSCPSKVYYCKVERRDMEKPLANINDQIKQLINDCKKEDASFSKIAKDALRFLIPSLKIQKIVFLYNSKADVEGEYLGVNLKEEGNIEKKVGFEGIDKLVALFEDPSLIALVDVLGEILSSGVLGDKYLLSKECGYAEYTGDKPTYNLACTYTRGFLNDFSSIATDYKNCGNNTGCKTQNLTKMNEKESGLKSYCNNIIENYNYDGDVEQDCIDSCFEVSDTILAIKKNVGLGNNRNGECGFSTRLASWGLNIMKWIKYIVPVFVIIFGIFDFIKAIGADKEDEMKKSQKKFITRLIAAALIFIIPFILEFVLDKFGFTEYIDGCGVIEEIG